MVNIQLVRDTQLPPERVIGALTDFSPTVASNSSSTSAGSTSPCTRPRPRVIVATKPAASNPAHRPMTSAARPRPTPLPAGRGTSG